MIVTNCYGYVVIGQSPERKRKMMNVSLNKVPYSQAKPTFGCNVCKKIVGEQLPNILKADPCGNVAMDVALDGGNLKTLQKLLKREMNWLKSHGKPFEHEDAAKSASEYLDRVYADFKK